MSCPICGADVPVGAIHCPACGGMVGQQTLPVGTVLQDKYRIDGLLGQGGFGITYAATQTQLGAQTAIKELFPDGSVRLGRTLTPPVSLGVDGWRKAQQSFIEEARILARFNHPDIVRVLDFFEESSSSYMVMERLQGETLQERLNRVNHLPMSEVEQLALRLTSVLQIIHDAGLLHRDIKPANIFMELSGRVVLVDFGSAREFVNGETVSHTRLVSPGYAPLEQYGSAARFGPYSDIYALGATLYHAITGHMPPPATDLIQGVSLPPLPPATPENLRQVVEQALAARVSDRPQNAYALLRILESRAGMGRPQGAPHRPLPTKPPAPLPPSTGSRRSLLLGLLILLGGGMLLLPSLLKSLQAPSPGFQDTPTSTQTAGSPSGPPPRASETPISLDTALNPRQLDRQPTTQDLMLDVRGLSWSDNLSRNALLNKYYMFIYNRNLLFNEQNCNRSTEYLDISGYSGGDREEICRTTLGTLDMHEIYNAIRESSDHMNYNLVLGGQSVLKGTLPVRKNQSKPLNFTANIVITKSTDIQGDLHATWTPIEGAKYYQFIYCSEESINGSPCGERVGFTSAGRNYEDFRLNDLNVEQLSGRVRFYVEAYSFDPTDPRILKQPDSEFRASRTHTLAFLPNQLMGMLNRNIACTAQCSDTP